MSDYIDEWPGKPASGWPTNPYDEDGYCDFCGNGSWKYHAPWCRWADARDAGQIEGAADPTGWGDRVTEFGDTY